MSFVPDWSRLGSEESDDDAWIAVPVLARRAHDGRRAVGRPAPHALGHPDLQGIWDQTTGTPLERAPELADRAFLTEEEAVQREARRFSGFDEAPRSGSPGNYGSQWRDGSRNALTRTSLVVDPPDGRVPALTAAGERQREAAEARRRDHPADSWVDRNLWERCLTRGTPRVPNNYNSNLLILQTPDAVVILNEMINETRVIPLDGRPHVASGLRQWNGDPRGRWEGDTLVVETTQLQATSEMWRRLSSGADCTLVERFTRSDAGSPSSTEMTPSSIPGRGARGRGRSSLPMTAHRRPDVRVRLSRGQPRHARHPCRTSGGRGRAVARSARCRRGPRRRCARGAAGHGSAPWVSADWLASASSGRAPVRRQRRPRCLRAWAGRSVVA